jgi:lambda repressor-like predicted transcriptional regulator
LVFPGRVAAGGRLPIVLNDSTVLFVRLAVARVRRLARERGLSLSRLLSRAGVSRTAFYSLARRDSVFPKTIREVARTLGVASTEILEPSADRLQATLERRLARARSIVASVPGTDFHNVWHTLFLLELPPAERLNRSLLRGRARRLHS